jgi:hypothetical protein
VTDPTSTTLEQVSEAAGYLEMGGFPEHASALRSLVAQVEALTKERDETRQAHGRLARAVKSALGLENWPEMPGLFADAVGALVKAERDALRIRAESAEAALATNRGALRRLVGIYELEQEQREDGGVDRPTWLSAALDLRDPGDPGDPAPAVDWRARAEAAEKRLRELSTDWLVKRFAIQRAADLIAKPAACHTAPPEGLTGTPRYSEGLRIHHRECAELLPVLRSALEGKGEARKVRLPAALPTGVDQGDERRWYGSGFNDALSGVKRMLTEDGIEVEP